MQFSYNMVKPNVETQKYAKQANGSVLVRYGDTVLLVTATASKTGKELTSS